MFYSYAIQNNQVNFTNREGPVEKLVLKNGEWTRFDRNGTEDLYFEISPGSIQNMTTYQYFEIQDNVQTNVAYQCPQGERIPFNVQQDCKYDILYIENCRGTFENHTCVNGSRQGLQKIWWKEIIAPLHGGVGCPTHNPLDQECVDVECDQHCLFESDTDWSSCMNDGHNVSCGTHGHQYWNYYITQISKYNGQQCPTNRSKPCVGPFAPGTCDCQGHTRDGCGKCGGTCCPVGQKRDKCGVCNGTNDCTLRLARERMKQQQLHEYSQTMRLLAPSLTFALLTAMFTFFCYCLCQEST
jgi:hypothetical protein